jgi:periplasmic divalent cation tolerance protein
MSDHDHDKKKVAVLLSTCPPDVADSLATKLVEGGLVACVNILPQVSSVYRWEGKLEKSQESLLVIKCSRERVEEVTAEILKHHPYSVPEVLGLRVKGGNPAYMDWVVAGG